MDVVRAELADDPTVDITTTGRTTGLPRRIEIWMLDVLIEAAPLVEVAGEVRVSAFPRTRGSAR